ncbi:MAG: glycosyltransferase [Anaerolineae bacterium]|nr:glycosyltransferase [Anaerolineae bacterium]
MTGQFNDSFAPIMDGVGVAVQNYALWLNRLVGPAYVVTPAAPHHVDRYEFGVLRYFSLPVPTFRPYRMGIYQLDPEFWQAVRSISFDLVHAHCPFTSGRLARRIAHQRDIPLVATFHTKYRDNLERYTSSRNVVERYLAFITDFYRSADQVWVPNRATGETLREYGYRGPMEVVPNGSDVEMSAAERAAMGAQANRELGLDPDELVFLFVGQHIWEKNVAFLIRALERAQHLGLRFTMLFVGQGYAAETMRDMVAQAGLGSAVRFLGLIRDRERLQRLYARADLYLFPSVYDNAPLTVREAAAAYLPAVLIRGCAAAEGIVDRENGFLSDDSVHAYARTIRELAADAALRKRAGLLAHHTLFRSWEDIVGEVAQRYADVIQRHATSRAYSCPWPAGLQKKPGLRASLTARIPMALLRTQKDQPWLASDFWRRRDLR